MEVATLRRTAGKEVRQRFIHRIHHRLESQPGDAETLGRYSHARRFHVHRDGARALMRRPFRLGRAQRIIHRQEGALVNGNPGCLEGGCDGRPNRGSMQYLAGQAIVLQDHGGKHKIASVEQLCQSPRKTQRPGSPNGIPPRRCQEGAMGSLLADASLDQDDGLSPQPARNGAELLGPPVQDGFQRPLQGSTLLSQCHHERDGCVRHAGLPPVVLERGSRRPVRGHSNWLTARPPPAGRAVEDAAYPRLRWEPLSLTGASRSAGDG